MNTSFGFIAFLKEIYFVALTSVELILYGLQWITVNVWTRGIRLWTVKLA